MAFKDKLSKFFGFSKKENEELKNDSIAEEAEIDGNVSSDSDSEAVILQEQAKAEEEAKKAAEEQARAEEEARKIAEEKARAEEEAKKAAEEQARAEEEAKKAAEEQARAEEARKIAEEKARAEEEARKIAEEKARAEEEAKKAAEEQARAEEEAKKAAEEQARAEEEARKIAEEQAKAEEEARKIAEEKARAEEEARKIAEEKARAEEEAKKAAEEKAKAEEEAKKAAEEQAKAEEEAKEAAEEQEMAEEEPAPKKGFFAKLKDGLTKTRDSINSKIDGVLSSFKKVDEELFEELEEALIMADVGVDTSLYIIGELRKKVKENKISETEQVKGAIEEIISELLCKNDNGIDVSTNPAVIMVIGVNGVGKTTSIGKMAARYKAEGKKVILGAADTFRAAAIDQLQVWADRSGVEIIKHQEGSDPASVVFDTIAAAKSRGSDLIILDTAGRLHNKKNLMDELAKISRIIERELPESSVETLLVLDATTGQNAVNQSKLFSEAASISGLILTKLDGSAKGGIVLAISHEQNIPVKLVGVGEAIDDLQDFVPADFAKALFS